MEDCTLLSGESARGGSRRPPGALAEEGHAPLMDGKAQMPMEEDAPQSAEQQHQHWEFGEPVPGDVVEVILQDRWHAGTLLQDQRSQCSPGHRWVVRLESGEEVDAPLARKVHHGEIAVARSAPPDHDHLAKRVRQSLLLQFHGTPLQSVMRRGRVLSFMEVQSWDHLSSETHRYLVALDIAISYCIVLTSFFFLQNYELPGVLTAWSPYKLVFELVVASVLRAIFRVVVEYCLVGAAQRRFSQVALAIFLLYDISIWVQIFGSFRAVYGGSSLVTWQDVVDVLDITVGAGIILYLSSKLSVTFGMLLFSAYVYEPLLRHRDHRTVRLTSQDQVEQLLQELEGIRQDAVEEALRGGLTTGKVGWEFTDTPIMLSPTVRGGMISLPWSAVFPDSLGISACDFLADPPPKRSSSSTRGAYMSQDSDLSSAEEEALCSEEDIKYASQVSKATPIVVTLRKSDVGRLRIYLVWLLDLVMSVDVFAPVCRKTRSHEGDWIVPDGMFLKEDDKDTANGKADAYQ